MNIKEIVYNKKRALNRDFVNSLLPRSFLRRDLGANQIRFNLYISFNLCLYTALESSREALLFFYCGFTSSILGMFTQLIEQCK